jgi:hypothetical protein
MNNTIKFAKFPFTHKGYNFVSRISEKSKHLPLIMMMGDEFIQMNKDAIDELVDIQETTTRDEVKSKIAFINEGGSEMFLELAGE